jgi:hypothetical protein
VICPEGNPYMGSTPHFFVQEGHHEARGQFCRHRGPHLLRILLVSLGNRSENVRFPCRDNLLEQVLKCSESLIHRS